MNIQYKLVILMLALTLDDQVETIIGGHEAVPHSRPYMVLLEGKMPRGKTKHCGGFLLNEDFVMTAAHCQAKSYTVLLGVHIYGEKTNGIQEIPADQAFPHEDYNPTDLTNDIMLLKLSSKAHFSKTVKPIGLAGQGDGSLPKSCIVSGWGTTNSNTGYMSRRLMEANVTLSDEKQCVTENSYCSQGDVGLGVGDGGGPLVCEDGKVYGVASSIFSPHGGGPKIYHYAKIPHYRHWIDSVMKHYGNRHTCYIQLTDPI
ncbi:granzyme E-like [Thunnus maccoyii]|uniref:granzyme E-like n=1 Tax=Thunnus maccoyii TaxID=8240 RepID=UPI001C4BAD43|nr:granzyme E-like [Thunnus maccoyii]